MRKFEKVSYARYSQDVGGDVCLKDEYNSIKIPSRATMWSAGYDFSTPFSFELEPKEIISIPTGIKARMKTHDVLKIYIRSSLGFKYGISLVNSVGIIDSDYYNNEGNEGHIHIKIRNDGDKKVKFNKGDRIAQGIFEKYYLTTADAREISCWKNYTAKPYYKPRNGGVGSTNE